MKFNKVVWLCQFANEALDEYFGLHIDQCAYWITQFIQIMEKSGLDIHIVGPNLYTNNDVDFKIKGINYHLYKYHSGIGGYRTATLEIALRKERNIRKKIVRIVDNIKPDIVHLFGAENITYSGGAIPIMNRYPLLVTFQGYVQLTKERGSCLKTLTIRQRERTEDTILSNAKYVTFEVTDRASRNYFINKYGNKKEMSINFPLKKPGIDASNVKKDYDVVYWGRVTKNKGVEDLIRAVSILKNTGKDLRCLILGGGAGQYLQYLHSLVEKLSLSNNIVFGGFQRTDEELFSNASKAKVYVLPTYFDALPCSIRESMLMRLPVISYPVGDITELNKNSECVVMAEYRNIEDLAEKIKGILSDDAERKNIADRAYNMINEMYDFQAIESQFMTCYDECLIENKKG